VFVKIRSIQRNILKSGVAAAIVISLATLCAVAADPTPGAIQAAQAIVLSTNMGQSFEGIVPQMLFDLERNVTTTRPDIKPQLHDTLVALMPEFLQTETGVMQSAALALASLMSEQELKDTAAFFQSASGKKWVETQPALFKVISPIVQGWRQKLSTDILARAREEMKKKGVDF
jgi:uncharacterized protein